jgi:hypothetical protein
MDIFKRFEYASTKGWWGKSETGAAATLFS